MNTHSSLPPPSPSLFFEGGNLKKIGWGSNFLKKSVWESKRGNTEEMGYSRKKNKGVEDMEFPGVLKKYNSKWNFQGLIKNNVKFLRVAIKKKSCGISRGLGFRS